MKYFYKLGYTDWEEHDYIILCSENKLTKKKFEQIVFECAEIAAEEEKEKQLELWKDETGENLELWFCGYHVTFSSILYRVVELICEKYEFEELQTSCILYIRNENLLNPEEFDNSKSDADRNGKRLSNQLIKNIKTTYPIDI